MYNMTKVVSNVHVHALRVQFPLFKKFVLEDADINLWNKQRSGVKSRTSNKLTYMPDYQGYAW